MIGEVYAPQIEAKTREMFYLEQKTAVPTCFVTQFHYIRRQWSKKGERLEEK